MKKLLIIALLASLSILTGCSSVDNIINYTDDTPFEIDMSSDSLKILQLTDLHLTYGIDSNDRKTFEAIDTSVNNEDYDLIVLTGDMTMSISSKLLFRKLVKHMESLETPWTFIFGNHENDYAEYTDYLNLIDDCEYLYFKVGPELESGGVGNFRILFNHDGVPFYTLYFMDSHAERTVYTEEEGEYDYVKESQVLWAETHLSEDTTDSVMYMHIPLRQFIDPDTYEGTFDEDKVYAQGVDTGLFDVLVEQNKTKGVFVGHDHLNEFTLDGVLLAYGQISGYNAYGNLPRGGRVVEVNSSGEMSTYIVYVSEVSQWNWLTAFWF